MDLVCAEFYYKRRLGDLPNFITGSTLNNGLGLSTLKDISSKKKGRMKEMESSNQLIQFCRNVFAGATNGRSMQLRRWLCMRSSYSFPNAYCTYLRSIAENFAGEKISFTPEAVDDILQISGVSTVLYGICVIYAVMSLSLLLTGLQPSVFTDTPIQSVRLMKGHSVYWMIFERGGFSI